MHAGSPRAKGEAVRLEEQRGGRGGETVAARYDLGISAWRDLAKFLGRKPERHASARYMSLGQQLCRTAQLLSASKVNPAQRFIEPKKKRFTQVNATLYARELQATLSSHINQLEYVSKATAILSNKLSLTYVHKYGGLDTLTT